MSNVFTKRISTKLHKIYRKIILNEKKSSWKLNRNRKKTLNMLNNDKNKKLKHHRSNINNDTGN